VKDVRRVIHALTQGTPDEQQEALYRYYAPSASFVHPFCRVPSFQGVRVPGYGQLDSRTLILSVLKWQILSPKIDIKVESSVFDQRANLLYVTSAQTFSLWFVPSHKAPVRLVTVLSLVPSDANGHHSSNSTTGGDRQVNGVHDESDGDEPEEPSYADVLSAAPGATTGNLDGHSAANAVAERTQPPLPPKKANNSSQQQVSSPTSSPSSRPRYLIQKHEDFYQVNEFLKFLFMAPGAAVWAAWQLFSTLLCVVGALLLAPLMHVV
ncbi:hypothetical protein B0T26DRAFT_627241, partial [Lasiosphaeria miniovina]